MSVKLQTILLVIFLALVDSLQAQTNSIYLRAEQKNRSASIRGRSLYQNTTSKAIPGSFASRTQVGDDFVPSVRAASWITVSKPRPKDVRVHDLVTIIVHEVSKHTTKADTKSEREWSIDAALTDWLRLTGGNLRPDRQGRGDPKLGFSFEREFEGKGDVKRSDTLTARIQAEIMDVLPNGNLILEATHTVVTDEEETVITLTGVCRSKDVGIDNTIMSTQLARLNIQKHHAGVARDATKRGLLSGLFDWIAPF